MTCYLMKEPTVEFVDAPLNLKGQKVAVIGRFSTHTHNDVAKIIEALGGIYNRSISDSNYVVYAGCNTKHSKICQKASKQGLKRITIEALSHGNSSSTNAEDIVYAGLTKRMERMNIRDTKCHQHKTSKHAPVRGTKIVVLPDRKSIVKESVKAIGQRHVPQEGRGHFAVGSQQEPGATRFLAPSESTKDTNERLDISMAAEYEEEIFTYMHHLEVCIAL